MIAPIFARDSRSTASISSSTTSLCSIVSKNPQHAALAETRQRVPQLRLEDDQRRDRAVLEEHLQQIRSIKPRSNSRAAK